MTKEEFEKKLEKLVAEYLMPASMYNGVDKRSQAKQAITSLFIEMLEGLKRRPRVGEEVVLTEDIDQLINQLKGKAEQ